MAVEVLIGAHEQGGRLKRQAPPVSFDHLIGGRLHHCVVARRRINERLIGEDLDVKLVLDRAARLGRRKNQARAARKRSEAHAHVGLLFKLATPPRQHRARR
jgi:hypothetical protein